jgi:hypothetical protein
MVEKIRRTGGQVNNIGLGFGIGKFNNSCNYHLAPNAVLQ